MEDGQLIDCDFFGIEKETPKLHLTLEKGQQQPSQLWDVLSQCSPDGPWVCGGAARRLYFEEYLTTDIDVFCKGPAQCEAITEWLLGEGAIVLQEAKGNTTYEYGGMLVQVVKSFYPSLGSVLDSFDFRICCFGCDGQQVIYTEMGHEDARNKRLEINNLTLQLPLYSLARIIKYQAQGFRVTYPEGMLAKLADAAHKQLAKTKGSELSYGDL